MKHVFLALLFLAFEAAGLRAAAAQAGTDGDPAVRTIPPIRIALTSRYQRWTQDGARLQEISFPVTAQLRLRPHLGVNVGVSQAVAEGDDLEQVNGLTDVHLAVDYHLHLAASRLVFTLGVNVPTGTSKLTEEAYDTAFQLGLSQYNFTVPHFGQGVRVAPGVVYVTSLTRTLVVSIGGAYHARGSFQPVSGLPDRYHWGNEYLFVLGGEWQLGGTVSLSADATYTRYQADKVGGVTVYEAGNRLTTQVQLHKTVRRHDLWLGARYRRVDTNRVRAGGMFRPESARAFPGLLNLYGRYRMRLSRALRATLSVDASRYEADFAFEQTDVYTIGFAPEFSLTPGLTIPVQGSYAFGDLEGLEAGLGVVAIF